MQHLDTIVSHYGWEGIALIIITLTLFSIQLGYWAMRYARISKYKDSKRPSILTATPSVSVVVPLFSEDYPFLDESLPLIMAQEGVDFEVVIVYVGSNKDFYDDLLRLKQLLPSIVVSKIESNPRFPISVKTALNVGVKASHYEHIIFCNTDCQPQSDRWLSLMASGFKRGDIVIGYTGLAKASGFANYFMRQNRMMNSVNWISSAIGGTPYRGARTNIGWTKSKYFESRGFTQLNMNIGENDLFIQNLIDHGAKVSVIISPRATLRQKCWGGASWWFSECRLYRSSFELYPSHIQNYELWERRSRVLLALSTITMILCMPVEIKIAAAALLLARAIIVFITTRKISKRLGEEELSKGSLLYDILSPLYAITLDLSLKVKRDSRVWR
ncbi:MAG: glycosyltransferase [Rikenellaceae bacterium]